MVFVILVCCILGVYLLTLPGQSVVSLKAPQVTQNNAPLDIAVVCDLLAVAIGAGVSLPRAVEAVGDAIGGEEGRALGAASRALQLGSTWDRAWSAHMLGETLRPAWIDGADPGPLLAQAARTIRANRQAIAKAAAARLAVQLVLPVGLCLLPAFVLVGIVPVLVSGGISILGG